MSGWTAEELDSIGRAEELQVASRRPDNSLRPFTTIWVVRAGDDIYVRSAYGWDNGWFQRALKSGAGRVRAAGVERDATFEPARADTADAVTGAYRDKYGRYGATIVGSVISDEAVRSTLRVVPVDR